MSHAQVVSVPTEPEAWDEIVTHRRSCECSEVDRERIFVASRGKLLFCLEETLWTEYAS